MKRNNGREIEMTPAEKRILEIHNASYEKQAKSVTIYDLCRFYLDYQNGTRKHDHECGPTFKSLAMPIIIV